MSARTFARWSAAVLLAASMAGCSSNRAAPSGSTPASFTADSAAPVTDTATTTQVPTAATPLVHQAVLDYWTALRRCQQRPSSCNPATFTADEGALRDDVRQAVATMVANGWHRAADDSDDDTAPRTDGGYVVVGAVTVAADATTATADACVDDPAPLLGPGEVVVTSDSAAHHFAYTIYLEAERWRVGDEQIDTSDTCALAPDTVAPDFTTPGN
jgi:hypothetical protein